MADMISREAVPKLLELASKLDTPKFFYKASGFIDEELERPLIGIVNTWQEATLGHLHLRQIADAVKAGVYLGGGTPIEFNLMGPCTGYSEATRNYRFDLPQRDAIADSIEIQLEVLRCKGIVCIATCDKEIPGVWLGAARKDLPTIIITGGPALPGKFRGEATTFPTDCLVPCVFEVISGKMSEEEFWRTARRMEEEWVSTCGACPEMTTSNTLQMLSEALGLSLPGANTAPAVSMRKIRFAKRTGMQIVKLVETGFNFSRIVTREAVENAIRVLMAVSGGTNGVLHLLALANELGLDITLDDFDRLGKATKYLCHLRPSGPYTVVDFDNAGGVPALMKELEKDLNLDCITVTGKTVRENLAEARVLDSEVIRPQSNPILNEGGIAVLRGNLAPNGAVSRFIVVKKELHEFEGSAKVFDTEEEAMFAIASGSIESGDAIVVRYQGPRGAPGMPDNLVVVFMVSMMGLENVAVVSDGRFSGTTIGALYVGHVSPEAYIGGPIAAVQNGDTIRISIPERRIDVDLSDEEIKTRLEAWKPPEPRVKKGVLVGWLETAEQAEKGAVLKRSL
ncbi:MAG: dihydroxy-acid dehydratase [Candidatus Freyrarchaeum guaymaensis]